MAAQFHADSIGQGVVITTPTGVGGSGQVLTSDGAGGTTWETPSAGGTPGGSDGQVQINSSGTFGAITGSSFSGGVVTLPTLAVTDLTSGRIPFAGTSGRLQDSANLTWTGTSFKVRSTTAPQMVVDYDVNNALKASVSSTGGVTFDATSANVSGAGTFNFAGKIAVGPAAFTPNARIYTRDASITTFTSTTNGALAVGGTGFTAGNFIPFDFKIGNEATYGAVSQARIAMQMTNNGSVLVFGTSNSFTTGITTQVAVMDYAGNVGIGQTTFGTSASKVLALGNGALTGNIADASQMYSADYSAGNACMHFREEGGAVIKLKRQAKASYNNWSSYTDIVDALVAMGIFDAA